MFRYHPLFPCLLLPFLLLLPALSQITELPSFYHTSDTILDEFRSLAEDAHNCEGATITLSTTSNSIVPLTVATFKYKGEENEAEAVSPPAPATNRVMILFGEHARELISPETALRMAYDLCGKNSETKELAQKVLQNNVITMIPIANPKGRHSVERGNYCQRVNENGVDLNRNWDSHWEGPENNDDKDTYPGTKPFSEPETQALKKILDDLQPTLFITVHSGTLGMYTPYAFSTDLPTNDPTDLHRMKDILNELNPQYCRCPSGAAGLDVGYLCPGTCLDYAYEHHASISFAFEIYASDMDAIHTKWDADHASTLLEVQDQLSGGGGGGGGDGGEEEVEEAVVDTSSYSCFLQASTKAGHHQQHSMRSKTNEDCFATFNPSDEGVYKDTVAKWSEAFLKMCDMAAASALIRDLNRANPQGGGDSGNSPLSLLKTNLAQPAVRAVEHMLRMKESRRNSGGSGSSGSGSGSSGGGGVHLRGGNENEYEDAAGVVLGGDQQQ